MKPQSKVSILILAKLTKRMTYAPRKAHVIDSHMCMYMYEKPHKTHPNTTQTSNNTIYVQLYYCALQVS